MEAAVRRNITRPRRGLGPQVAPAIYLESAVGRQRFRKCIIHVNTFALRPERWGNWAAVLARHVDSRIPIRLTVSRRDLDWLPCAPDHANRLATRSVLRHFPFLRKTDVPGLAARSLRQDRAELHRLRRSRVWHKPASGKPSEDLLFTVR